MSLNHGTGIFNSTQYEYQGLLRFINSYLPGCCRVRETHHVRLSLVPMLRMGTHHPDAPRPLVATDETLRVGDGLLHRPPTRSVGTVCSQAELGNKVI